ncbi:MAG: WHG domain-containing protein [Acidimicrobiia bacterium]|nr:WHG domain-containing protein [Acidimicrobiia bacterium]
MTRRRLDRDTVVTSAIVLADELGIEEVALGRVAEELGVQSSALYNHVDGVEGLRHAVAGQATANLADALRDAAVARAGTDALRAVAQAYRRFALDHPGQYARTLLPPANSEDSLVVSHRAITDLFVQILAGLGIEGETAIDTARTIRSAVHGFVALEAIDGFTHPQGNDRSFEHLVDILVQAATR